MVSECGAECGPNSSDRTSEWPKVTSHIDLMLRSLQHISVQCQHLPNFEFLLLRDCNVLWACPRYSAHSSTHSRVSEI